MIAWSVAVFSFVAVFRAAFALTGSTRLALLVVAAAGLLVLAYFAWRLLQFLE